MAISLIGFKYKKQMIEDLDGDSAESLNERGWFLLTYFQCRKDSSACASQGRAISKAESSKRTAGIRTLEKEDYIVFEVWEKW